MRAGSSQVDRFIEGSRDGFVQLIDYSRPSWPPRRSAFRRDFAGSLAIATKSAEARKRIR
jgi:hypothetical protein